MDKTCIYLRKSRADEEMEKLGQGETLSKHRKALLKYAKEKNLNIVEIKEEIVSGDSLFHRPKMLELLKEVENKEYSGVLVMDIDRLGRGGMKDQGIILDAFKESNTKIITPTKTYDLNNDLDEEMTEFKTFFSRRELKTINRRMQGGRIRSVEDGNYIATNAPYGYDIDFIQKSRTLKINEPESNIVKIIFKMYIEGNGAGTIANYLNSLNCKTKANRNFTSSSVLFILRNPVYIGKITWKKREYKKSLSPDKIKDCRTRDKEEWIVVTGKHQPLIDIDTFNRANEILQGKYHIPYKLNNPPANQFAGIVECGICGKKMIMRKVKDKKRLMCIHKCGNKSVRLDFFEKEVLKKLESYLRKYKAEIENNTETNSNVEIYSKQIIELKKELTLLSKQKLNLFDLLERGIYTEDIFIERSNNINTRIQNLEQEISKLNNMIEYENTKLDINHVVMFENVINGYKSTNDIQLQNELLKTIISEITYLKTPEQKNDDFSINVHIKLLR
ncbi:recombinase family protein [Clostridium butyricum]|uniref:recombinase family protein n=1 Tax=Clostridium butyricum TaxID=1492 RepID=UPI002AB0BDF5|nr:recombinase family protein [Clostridium butyricum]